MTDTPFLLRHRRGQYTLLDPARLLVVYTEDIPLAKHPQPAAFRDLPAGQQVVYVLQCVLLSGQTLEFAFDGRAERTLVFDQLLEVMSLEALYNTKYLQAKSLKNIAS